MKGEVFGKDRKNEYCLIYHAFLWLLDVGFRAQVPNRALCILYHAKRLISGFICEIFI